MGKKFLTKESFEKLAAELDRLRYVVRKEIALRLREARELGGNLGENAAYLELCDQQVVNEEHIQKIEAFLREAVIVQRGGKRKRVEVGVTIKLSSGLSFQLVDSFQASPPDKISVESPMGKAFLGKREGQEVLVEMPNGRQERYTILAVDSGMGSAT